MQEHTNIGVVGVPVHRIIRIGCRYRIHPSYGWAGIEEGTVLVMGIILPAEDEYCLAQCNDYVLATAGEPTEEPEYMDEVAALHDEYWVAYQYIQGGYEDMLHELQYMPLSIFCEHVTQV